MAGNGNLEGGSIRVLWDADDTAEVTITNATGSAAAFTVGGSAVTFPYTLSASTTFETEQSGTFEVSVLHHGIEIADTPDGTRTVRLRDGSQEIFAPTPDASSTPQFLSSLMDGLNAAIAGEVVDAYDTDAGALGMVPSSGTPAYTVADPGGIRYPGWLSKDRTVLFNLSGVPTVNYSLDNGATWNGTVNSLPAGVQAVRDLADGEILVSAGDNPGSLYRSSGWATDKATATFTEVLAASSPNVYFHNSYGLWVEDDGLILAAEYGSKVAGANARYVYLSRDYGVTWTTILDIGGTADTHTHGVAYDKWWKRIWVTRGDATREIYFSDDLGATWDTVTEYQTSFTSAAQSKVTTIFPMAGCVLFMSDSAPNGVLRIRRQNRTNPVLEDAHLLNSSSGITHIGQLAYQANVPGAPVLMAFTNDPAAGYTGPGVLLATTDGFRFWELWTDTIDYGAFGGLVSAVGPTTSGTYLGTLIDGRQARYSRLTVTAPTWAARALPKPSNAIGDETMPRTAAASEATPISGTLLLSYLTASESRSVTMIRAFTASVAAAAGATLFRLGLYRVDPSGNLTLIAAGANDTTKITSAYTSVAQTVDTRVTAGGRYAVGVLCVGAGTMPSLAGITAAAASGTRLPSGALFIEPKISAQLAEQTDLPATIPNASLAASARVVWHALAS